MKALIKLFILIMIIGFVGTSNNSTITRIRGFVYITYNKVCNEMNKVDIDIKTDDNNNDNNIVSIDDVNDNVVTDNVINNNNNIIKDSLLINNKVTVLKARPVNIDNSPIPEPAERTLGYIQHDDIFKKR